MSGLLSGKVCLITGSHGSIGKVITECFVKQGAYVYAGMRADIGMTDWAKSLSDENEGEVQPLVFDLANNEEIRGSIQKIKKEQNRLDILVNNAAIIRNESLGMIRMDEVRRMFEVNVFALIELSQLVATRLMVRQNSGSIINLSSIVGVEGSVGQTAYSASKGAVISITKSMSRELASWNIRVNAVAPSMVATEKLDTKIKNEYKDSMPPIGMGRLATPQEVADACLYFASDMSTYTTGQVLVVGGGYDTSARAFFDISYKE